MRTTITQAIVQKLKPGSDQWIYDTKLPGLVLRVRPSGVNSYLALLGRGKWYTIGRADVLKPETARELAQGVLGDVAHGKDPIVEKRKKRAATLEDFIREHYEPWATTNRKTGEGTVDRLRSRFKAFSATKLDEITPFAVERWRSARLKDGRTAATVNRDLVALKSALQKAVEWRIVDKHPLSAVKLTRVDTVGKVRYLSAAEEQRLRTALLARDGHRRGGRERGNDWRKKRGYRERPRYGSYSDNLTPLVLLALNTGLRFGELTALTWTDVDLTGEMLTVRAEGAKSAKARYIPLNTEALSVLRAWKPTEKAAGFVFPGKALGERLTDIKTAWLKVSGSKGADISDFRFHDLRHTFASRLVQRGVDLNTVRELLGHADIKMTLRYAHLAPEHKAAAVARLVSA